ncbi:hypothetical protein KXW98_007652, partial [Aspergillus fumigatus]
RLRYTLHHRYPHHGRIRLRLRLQHWYCHCLHQHQPPLHWRRQQGALQLLPRRCRRRGRHRRRSL